MKKFSIFLLSFLFLAFGAVGGFYGVSFLTLPQTEEVSVTEEIYYSKTPQGDLDFLDVSDSDISVHFLELGNKYTGDCTYIKTANADILIDCGSKSNSVDTVASYLENYVTDGKLEYVIVTHAHQDHYAGFATTTKVESIFDKFECETIIDFAKTNQKETSAMYKNYQRELADEIANGANHYTALDCINGTNGGQKVFDLGNGISMEILNSFYYSNKSASENDYSVCVLISQGEKHFLFTGDLEEQGEAKLVELNDLPKVDLYKAGHHGSKTSSTEDFLKVIQPKTVCVCCCAGSPEYTKTPENQFPTQIFINNVAKWTQEIYVTTLCVDYANNEFTSFNGNIVYLSKDDSYVVKCSNNNTILRESDWFKQNRTWPT